MALIGQCLLSFTTTLYSDHSIEGGGSADQGGGGDEFGTGVHFQGMKAKGPRAAPHADKTEGQGGGSPWTSFKFSLGAFCQRIFNVLCIT